MKKVFPLACLLCVVFPVAGIAESPRDAAAILKDYDEVKVPVLNATQVNDSNYVRSYVTQRSQALDKRARLAREFYAAHPDHLQALSMMIEAWSVNAGGANADRAIGEMEQFL